MVLDEGERNGRATSQMGGSVRPSWRDVDHADLSTIDFHAGRANRASLVRVRLEAVCLALQDKDFKVQGEKSPAQKAEPEIIDFVSRDDKNVADHKTCTNMQMSISWRGTSADVTLQRYLRFGKKMCSRS
ncbi:hypothetical protein OCU04_001564 [Sclerotinia nivalis]|uniref:Uncharacterized protein n=1 Tax=Sclerotinia nivalis TaxID=352851 RepID=A0A9X0AZ20_9HELO|nr:hypothetical protein OCU04_001564 [Sclerotinia nivalis]